MRYPAIMNGRKTTAEKIKGRWHLGGDIDTSGSVSILMNRDSRPAWFTLRGCFLTFSDYADAGEIAAYQPTS